eukprot:GDKJ01034829.1.p1 GENE.GDKJ01034829.1~~GDKJ01034829.1.p1  ORF type:complete len:460 (+),score=63.33 GDKJ01034829.1:101-1381(+)
MKKLRSERPEDLQKILSVTVECLQWLGLAYSANVVAVESGFKPTEFTKRDGLASSLGLTTAAGSPSILGQLLAGGGNTSVASSADHHHHHQSHAHQQPQNVTNTSANNISAFGSANVSAIAPVTSATTNTTTAASVSAPSAATAPVNPNDIDDTSAVKPHRMSENSKYVISRWSNRTFKRKDQISGQPMNIDYLDDCKLYVMDDMDSTNIDDCNNTVMVFASVANSIFLRTCHNCTIYAACKQFRVRDCTNCKIHLFAGTDPVVETSSNIHFKPLNIRLPGMKTAFKKANLDPSVNRFVHVYDFNAEDTKYPEPHFIVTNEGHGLKMENMCAEDGTPECPPEIEMLLDGRLAPAASVESGQNKSHNIKTGAQAWTAPPVEAAPAPAAAASDPNDDEGSDNGKYSDYESSSAKSSSKYSHSEDEDTF